MANNEVAQILKNVPGFIKCDSKDTFNGKVKKLESSVINLDNSNGMGTHFTCFSNLPNHNQIYYFDSFGAPPPVQIHNYLISSNKPIAYNTSQYQPIASKLCGYYCCYVIEELSKGKPFYDILSTFDLNNYNKNDQMMKQYFS